MTPASRSTIVFGTALSHSPMMMVPELDAGTRGVRFRSAVEGIRAELADARIDTVVLFFPDHFRMFHYRNAPSFCIGLRRLATWGDWRIPKRDELAVDEQLARHLLGALFDSGFDPAFSTDMKMDHGGAQSLSILGLEDVRIVPVFVNCAAPPLPSPARCWALGSAIGEAIRSFTQPRRVAVVGSGGLSHQVPFPSWDSLDASDERYPMFVTGIDPESLEAVEEGRIRQFSEAVGRGSVLVNEELDRSVLNQFADGDLDRLLAFSTEELTKQGGEGMNEVRTWVAAFAAAHANGAHIASYEPIPAWATGMGAITFGPKNVYGS